MAETIEAFLPDVYIAGNFAGTVAELHALLDSGSPIEVTDLSLVHVANLLAGAPDRVVSATVSADELMLMAAPPDPNAVTIHSVFFTVELWLGPYQVAGDMATLPGFDPGRALARPSSAFIALRDARVRIVTPTGTLDQSYPSLLVNRFAVERMAGDIDLSFWFPGAEQLPQSAT